MGKLIIQYDIVIEFENLTFLQCPKCGALLVDKTLHTKYHESLMKVKDFMDQHQSKT
jgi:hypothetical protein